MNTNTTNDEITNAKQVIKMTEAELAANARAFLTGVFGDFPEDASDDTIYAGSDLLLVGKTLREAITQQSKWDRNNAFDKVFQIRKTMEFCTHAQCDATRFADLGKNADGSPIDDQTLLLHESWSSNYDNFLELEGFVEKDFFGRLVLAPLA